MDEIKSLIEKPTTSEQPEKPQNSSQKLSPRQAAIVALIQQTQARRGLPLISVGFELQNVVLVSWEKALKNVPDAYLSRAYDHATGNWPWAQDRTFTPDAVALAYTILLVEDRQRQESERRNAARRNPDTYRCWHCCDIGYQPVYQLNHGSWYSALRPCVCDAAPLSQRSVLPLEEPEFVRNKLSEYVRRSDLDKYGPPNDHFKNYIKTPA